MGCPGIYFKITGQAKFSTSLFTSLNYFYLTLTNQTTTTTSR